MNDKEIRRYQMFVRVRDFGAAHADAFPPPALGSKLFAAVGEVVNELSGHAATQVSGNRTARQGTATKAVLRNELREDLAAIVRTSRSIELEKPGLEDKFRLPRNDNDQLLINVARAFATDAAPFAEEFVSHEMPADFLEELNRNIALFEKAVSEQNQGTAAQVTATAAIDQAIERGMFAVRKLDSVVRNKFRDDPSMLAAWFSASHTERSPSTAVSQETPAVAKS